MGTNEEKEDLTSCAGVVFPCAPASHACAGPAHHYQHQHQHHHATTKIRQARTFNLFIMQQLHSTRSCWNSSCTFLKAGSSYKVHLNLYIDSSCYITNNSTYSTLQYNIHILPKAPHHTTLDKQTIMKVHPARRQALFSSYLTSSLCWII